MARGSRGSNLRYASARRATGWEEGPGTFTDVGAFTASQAVILGSGQSFVFDGDTVVRIRGFAEISLSSGTADGDGYTGAFGIGIVTDAAFAAGVASVPTPITEIEWEGWIWHQMFSVRSPATDSTEIRQTFEIDSKAMRKVGSNRTIFAVVEATEIGTAVAEITLGSRMLLKLP